MSDRESLLDYYSCTCPWTKGADGYLICTGKCPKGLKRTQDFNDAQELKKKRDDASLRELIKLESLTELIRNTPNDTELGVLVRRYYLANKDYEATVGSS